MARRTKADAELTRQKLLDAAELLFLAHGVSRTSLQDIAAAAGATRGAIYWHFQDKADLFNAMMERVTLPLEQALHRASEPGLAAEPPLPRLLDAMLMALEVTVSDPRTRRVFEIAVHKVEYVDGLQAVARRRLEITRRLLCLMEQAIQKTAEGLGQPLPMPLPVAARGLQLLFDGLFNNWLLDPGAFDLVEVGRQTLGNYLRGLGLGNERTAVPRAPQ